MNLLFIDSIDKTTYGGMEEWIRLVSNGLADRGHNATVVGRPGSRFLSRMGLNRATKVKVLPMNLSGDFNPVTIVRLKREIGDRSIDLVCANFNRDIRLGGIAALLEGRAKLIWSAGLDITRDNVVHRTLTPRLLDRVIVPSSALKKQVTQLGYISPELVEVIPIGIGPVDQPHRKTAAKDLCRKYNLPPESIVAITSGRFVKQKGHTYLIEAASRIAKEFPSLVFLWVGDGPLEKELKEQVNRAGLGKSILFAGMLDSVVPELAGADLMIHPSIEEPFGISILEGMRAGLPIIASRVGGIPEVVAENESATLVEPKEPTALAEAVKDLLHISERMAAMGKAGYERWQSRFRLEIMIDSVESCFRRACETDQPAPVEMNLPPTGDRTTQC